MDSTPSPGPHGAAPPNEPPAAQPAYPPPAAGTPRPERGTVFFDSLRRSGLARAQDRWIGGVASGIASRLGIDPLLVRGAFVVLALFGGAAIVVYGVAWALLPEAADGRIHLEEAVRGRFDAALAGSIAFVLVGLARPTFWLDSGRWLPGWLMAFTWLGLVATLVLVAVLATTSSRRARIDRQAGQATGLTTTPAAIPSDTPPSDTEGEGPMSPPPATGGTTATGTPTAYPGYVPPVGGQAPPTRPPTPGYHGYVPPSPAYVPAPTTWQAPPKKPRVPGPGAPTVGVTLALVLLTGAAVLIGHRLGILTGSAGLTIAGSTIVLLGLGALVSGARGRRAGALGGLAVLTAVFAVPAAVITSALPDWPGTVVADGPLIADNVFWAPSTATEAEAGYSYTVGEAQIDLTGPTWPVDGPPAKVAIEAGAGSTTVVVPSGLPLEVRARVGLGEIRTTLGDGWTRTIRIGGGTASQGEPIGSTGSSTSRVEASGSALDVALRSPDEGDVALIVTIDAALGDVVIKEDLR